MTLKPVCWANALWISALLISRGAAQDAPDPPAVPTPPIKEIIDNIIGPTPTPVPTPAPPSGPVGFALGTEVPMASLSYVANGTQKILQVAWDAYPDRRDFELIAIFPDQVLQVILRFPIDYANQIIFVGLEEESAGDGIVLASTTSGAVATEWSGDNLGGSPGMQSSSAGVTPSAASSITVTIPTDGLVWIGFQAPPNPGRYHMRFGIGPLKPRFPFLVLNSDQAAQPQLLHCPVAN